MYVKMPHTYFEMNIDKCLGNEMNEGGWCGVRVKLNIFAKFSPKIFSQIWDMYIVDQSPAFLTSDNFIRSNEIIRTKWPIHVVFPVIAHSSCGTVAYREISLKWFLKKKPVFLICVMKLSASHAIIPL